jgi:hypothetical protein
MCKEGSSDVDSDQSLALGRACGGRVDDYKLRQVLIQ